MPSEKRARQKAHRQVLAEKAERERRRRLFVRLAVISVLVFAAAAFALSLVGDEEPAATGDNADAAATEPAALPEGCSSETPPPADPEQYDSPPEMQLEDGVDYWAIIQTSCGPIELDLLERKAPDTVNNFVFLAREGFYDGLTWHRIVRNFVIQGGDPQGTGAGDAGYEFEDELPAKANEYRYGTVAMANSGPDTNGSQFFIVVHGNPASPEPPGLQPLYSIFGQVADASFTVIDQLSKAPVSTDPETLDRPLTPVFINSIEIEER